MNEHPHANPPSVSSFFQQRLTLIIFAIIVALLVLGIIIGLFVLGDDEPEPDNSPATSIGRVVYLAPASAPNTNIYIRDVDRGITQQLTDFGSGIEEWFTINDLGTRVAFAAPVNPETPNRLDIFMVDIKTAELTQLTNCAEANASCYRPAWHPNGQLVGYTREELDSDIEIANRRRAWLVDIDKLESSLLFSDEQIVGHTPRWGGGGERVALVSAEPVGILVYDYNREEVAFLNTVQDVMGVFSPDGSVFVYPELVSGAAGATYYSQLQLVNFETDAQIPISGGPQSPVEDRQAAFNPQGTHLAVARRYFDERFTTGGQIYVIDLATGEVEPLVVDASYSHGSVSWNYDGSAIAYQRFDYETTEVNVYVYDFDTMTSTLVVTDAFLPRFLPVP